MTGEDQIVSYLQQGVVRIGKLDFFLPCVRTTNDQWPVRLPAAHMGMAAGRQTAKPVDEAGWAGYREADGANGRKRKEEENREREQGGGVTLPSSTQLAIYVPPPPFAGATV